MRFAGLLGRLLVLHLLACARAPEPTPPTLDASSDVCVAACERRVALGCIEPKLVPNCVPTCRTAQAKLGYHPEKVAIATRDAMPELGVRCDR